MSSFLHCSISTAALILEINKSTCKPSQENASGDVSRTGDVISTVSWMICLMKKPIEDQFQHIIISCYHYPSREHASASENRSVNC